MATTQPLPRLVMSDVYWRFDGTPFASQAEFDAAIRDYQTRNWGQASWRPEQAVIPAARLMIRPDLSSFPLSQRPATVELAAADGVAFTAGALLLAAHNTYVAVLRSRDHRYFEGFRLVSPPGADTPLYEIQLGS
jgi:hypothetical protein